MFALPVNAADHPLTEEHYAEIVNEVMDNLENDLDPEIDQFLMEFQTLAYAYDSFNIDLEEPYHTKRLLVVATSYVDYAHLGAIETLRGPNNVAVLQFATIEATKDAHGKLNDLQGVVDAMTSLNIYDYGDSMGIMPLGVSCGNGGRFTMTYGTTTVLPPGGGWSTLYVDCGSLCGLAPAVLEIAILAVMTLAFPGVGTAVAGIIVSVHLAMLRNACSNGGHHGASIDIGKVLFLPVNPSASRIYSQPRPTFSISYNANGGSGAPGASTKICCSILWLSSTRPTHPSGRQFLGWSTSSTATTATYAAGGAFTLCGSSRTLYAVWSRIITWDYNGGSESPSSSFLASGNTFGTLPTPNPRPGYTFVGWFNTNAATDGTQISASSTVPSSDTTYWARWRANTYSVTFDMNNGTGGLASVTATYDTAMPTITVPTRAGYTFQGYWDATSGGTQYYNADGTSARTWDRVTDMTLYAQWTMITYTVTFVNWDGTVLGQQTVPHGGAAISPAAPVRQGFIFNGWDNKFSFVIQNMTITAIYELAIHAVTYSAGAGSGAPTDSNGYVAGATVTVSSVEPSRTGYSFSGWLYGGTVYQKGQPFPMPDSDVEFVAQWTQNPTYSVTYNTSGGTAGPVDSNRYAQGATVTVSSVKPTPMSGYSFNGWLYQGITYSGGQTFTMPATDVTLTAQWTQDTTPTTDPGTTTSKPTATSNPTPTQTPTPSESTGSQREVLTPIELASSTEGGLPLWGIIAVVIAVIATIATITLASLYITKKPKP
jgi:uncharacterized repeat protein (TIGR02543 family)